MSRIARMVSRVGVGVMVVGALAFGATQALATTRAPDDCQPCFSQDECNTCCIVVLHLLGGDCLAENCVCY